MVGTSVRDRMNDQIIANITASAIGTNRKRATPVRKNIGTVPKISPGKTWEGLAGGLIAAAAFAALATYWFFPELLYQASIPLALVMAAVSVLGDLAESAMKRGSNTKDAASILPGHGGFLDRLDSLLFNAPILYYFAKIYFQV